MVGIGSALFLSIGRRGLFYSKIGWMVNFDKVLKFEYNRR
jgi:hypothetical protein